MTTEREMSLQEWMMLGDRRESKAKPEEEEEAMTDIVNQYFRQFYPDPLDQEKFRFSSMLGGMREYTDRDVKNIFPPMVCADGFKMSVQGHCGAYCSPRDDFADKYTAVEVGFPSEREELLMPHIDGDENTDPTETVYGWVPIKVIEAVIEKHGGLTEGDS